MNYRGLKELQLLLRQMYKILTDLLPITRPSLWTNYTQNYCCQYTKNTLKLDSKHNSLSKYSKPNETLRSLGATPKYSAKFTQY